MILYGKTDIALAKLRSIICSKSKSIEKLIENEFTDYSISYKLRHLAFESYYKNAIFKKINLYADNIITKLYNKIIKKQYPEINNLIKYSENNPYYMYDVVYTANNDKSLLVLLSSIFTYNTAQTNRYI